MNRARAFMATSISLGITIVDDFAHNPHKIEATLSTMVPLSERVIAIFQPHGFGPTRFLKDDLIQVFKEQLRTNDILLMPEIYYAGGTVTKDISSRDIIDAVGSSRIEAHFFPKRSPLYVVHLSMVMKALLRIFWFRAPALKLALPAVRTIMWL